MTDPASPHVFVIAEAGVNHNGSPDIAQRLIAAASEAGADAVKFQTFRTETLVTATAEKAAYQMEFDVEANQLEMLRRLELSDETHRELVNCCLEHGIEFVSTAFDPASIELLRGLGMRRWKVPSGEITNLPHLRSVGALGQEVIVSTGMAEQAEVAQAVGVLEQSGTPRSAITVLHCTTAYPTPIAEVNLRAMQTLGTALPGVRIGYSDHTLGIEVAIAAAALGACVIEKHVTLDRSLPGPDHHTSLEPEELKAMVRAIRNVEVALGDGVKRPTRAELANRAAARRSLVAACDIAAGVRFTERNVTVKRPGTGVSPMRWDEYLGRVANRSYQKDDLIDA